ncbi:MAG TPA: hypothetical protein VNK04_16625 [Gemmataceae bacterium]|nr:hypothetical protein [Gemmataceae bacterium]
MNNHGIQRLRRAAGGCAGMVVLALVFLPACKDDGLSELERWKKRQEEAAQSLIDKGMKATRKNYPQGQAWSLDLSGMQLTDDMLRRLKGMGHITELNFSGSTITDDQLAIINDPEIGSLLLKLNLSNTGITDAGLDQLTSPLVLQELNLAETKVTAAGVERFRKRRQQDPKVRWKNITIILK